MASECYVKYMFCLTGRACTRSYANSQDRQWMWAHTARTWPVLTRVLRGTKKTRRRAETRDRSRKWKVKGQGSMEHGHGHGRAEQGTTEQRQTHTVPRQCSVPNSLEGRKPPVIRQYRDGVCERTQAHKKGLDPDIVETVTADIGMLRSSVFQIARENPAKALQREIEAQRPEMRWAKRSQVRHPSSRVQWANTRGRNWRRHVE